jgi:hypothetical protein
MRCEFSTKENATFPVIMAFAMHVATFSTWGFAESTACDSQLLVLPGT